MGLCLLKADRDEEIYVVWSSIVEDVTWIFESRKEVLEAMAQAYVAVDNNPFSLWLFSPSTPEEVLERVDELGTSAPVRGYDFDTEYLRVGANQQLPRVRLLDYAKALLADDEEGAKQWLVPY